MQPHSKSHDTSDEYHSKWGEILGTLIAIVTLTLPIVAIANFSPKNFDSSNSPTYQMSFNNKQ